jgi:hypothetical protein
MNLFVYFLTTSINLFSLGAVIPHEFFITGDINMHLDDQLIFILSSFSLFLIHFLKHFFFPTHIANNFLDLLQSITWSLPNNLSTSYIPEYSG